MELAKFCFNLLILIIDKILIHRDNQAHVQNVDIVKKLKATNFN